MRSPASGVLEAAFPVALILMGLAGTLIGPKKKPPKQPTRGQQHHQLTLPEVEENRLLSQVAESITALTDTPDHPGSVTPIAPRALEVFEQQLLPSATQLFSINSGLVEIGVAPIDEQQPERSTEDVDS